MTKVGAVAPGWRKHQRHEQSTATHAESAHGDQFAIGGHAAEGDEHTDEDAHWQRETENAGKRAIGKRMPIVRPRNPDGELPDPSGEQVPARKSHERENAKSLKAWENNWRAMYRSMVRIVKERHSNTQEMRGVEVRLFGVFPGVKASVKTCQCEMLKSGRGDLIPRRPAAETVFM